MTDQIVKHIAVLMTCHNRCDKTIRCLELLFNSDMPLNFTFKVFLVDDGSTDGTKRLVMEEFPQVDIIKGSGNLFWNKGMRLAWDSANEEQDYDFYIWLNDDTLLFKDAIYELLKCHDKAIKMDSKESIIVGACRSNESSNEFSYGGRTKNEAPIIPNGKLQECSLINGNMVLVPYGIFSKIGNLSSTYSHAMGDYDYGLRTIQAGFKNYSSSRYIAICNRNGLPKWANPNVTFKNRLKHFYSPTGLNIKEYIVFRKKFWENKWILFIIKAYARLIFPKLYKSLKL